MKISQFEKVTLVYDSNYMTLWKKKSDRKIKSPVVSMGLEDRGREA